MAEEAGWREPRAAACCCRLCLFKYRSVDVSVCVSVCLRVYLCANLHISVCVCVRWCFYVDAVCV